MLEEQENITSDFEYEAHPNRINTELISWKTLIAKAKLVYNTHCSHEENYKYIYDLMHAPISMPKRKRINQDTFLKFLLDENSSNTIMNKNDNLKAIHLISEIAQATGLIRVNDASLQRSDMTYEKIRADFLWKHSKQVQQIRANKQAVPA